MDRGFLIGTGLASTAMFAGVLFLTSPATSIGPPATPAHARDIDHDVPAISREPVQAAASNVYYAGCNEVRAAGLAPLYRDQPGYRPEMDGDNDGIACEPHRNDTQF